MAQSIIIDPMDINRASLCHQLAQINKNQISQFKSFNDAYIKILNTAPIEGVVIASTSEGVLGLSTFLEYIREFHPNLSLISSIPSGTLEEIRTLVGLGVDQILIRPFAINQLKDKMLAADKFRQQVVAESKLQPATNYFHARIDTVTEKLSKVSLSGWLTENCELPTFEASAGEATLFVDLENLKGLNSIGIRSWMLWMKTLLNAGYDRLEFHNLHFPILKQASFVNGFIPTTAVVNSFYLYYWSEELQTEKEFKITIGKDFATDKMILHKFREGSQYGEKKTTYEIDDSIKKFLKFYPGKIIIA